MSTAVINKGGRPSKYSEELAERVCAAIASAKGGMRSVLAEDPELPAVTTVMRWAEHNASFASALAHARAMRLKLWAEDILDIGDDEALDPNDKRIRIDVRKWLLSKEMHRVYGDKLDVTSGGEALAAPSHQIDARIQSIIMQAAKRKERAAGLGEEAQGLLE